MSLRETSRGRPVSESIKYSPTDNVPSLPESVADVPAISDPCVSVIIVTYYTGPLLWRSISSALEQDVVEEVVVVDNGNWPSTLANLIDMAVLEPRLKIVTGHNNVGFSTGCNLGARASSGKYLFILNPDAILPKDAVHQLLQEGIRSGANKPWLIGGRLVNADGTEQAGSRRRTLTPWTALVEMLRLDKLAPRHPYFRRFNTHTDPCPGKTIETPVISGACMLTSRADYFALSGMDERYFLHAEDIDFCLRFAQDGGKVLYCPDVDVLHLKSSSRASPLKIERRKAQSLNLYFRTHFSKPYPFGFVGFVCLMVWVGFCFRAARMGLTRVANLMGFNRRRGWSGIGRALRAARHQRRR